MTDTEIRHTHHQPSIAGEDSERLSVQTQGLGMWVFLFSEIMFFGAVFVGYVVYRSAYPAVFAEAGGHLNLLLGAVNTAILLTSSFCMVLAVNAAARGAMRQAAAFLGATVALGAVFLGLKFIEYSQEFAEGLFPGGDFLYAGSDPARAKVFFSLYFTLTGLHAVHMIIGIGMILALIVLIWRKKIGPHNYAAVDMIGLYWHFVDIVWIFIFPLMYLAGPR